MANHKWSTEDKMRAAMSYLITGDTEEAGKICGIPGRTIRDWTREAWWSDMIGEARRAKNDELDAAFTFILGEVVGEIKDRIKNGDEIIQKDGTPRRKKISARDATLVAAVLTDKRAILRGEPTRISKSVSEKERLKTLAGELEDIVGVKEEENKDKTADKNLH